MNPVFQFPFTPYDIQKKFMTELYQTIENKELGIFESPTGTGKSLSICCGALQWLKDNKQRILDSLSAEIIELKLAIANKCDSEDWLQEEYEKIKKSQNLLILQNRLEKIRKKDEEFKDIQTRVEKYKSNVNKSNNINKYSDTVCQEIENFEVHNVEDEDFLVSDANDRAESDSDSETREECEEDESTKVYISSRTHSQLSQFVGEIKRTAFCNNTRLVTLGSRQHYCINSDVTKLKNINLINERCLDMQKSKSKSSSVSEDGKVLKKRKTCTSCPYYNQRNISRLKDRLLVDIMDMEDLVKCGKKLKACPYYASRLALNDAEVILVSHAGLVSSGARSGVSLKLQNNVVIFDEAHGLTAALENAHAAPVSSMHLSAVKTYLSFYIDKYRARLSCKNLLHLNQVNFVVGKFIGIINNKNTACKEEAKIYTLEDFVIKAEIDHLNLHPLVEFCKNTRLAPKLHGFSKRYNQIELEDQNRKTVNTNFKEFLKGISKNKCLKQEEDKGVNADTNEQRAPEVSPGSGLYAVLEFTERLCERSADGRVVARRNGLHYVLLNPTHHFAPLVEHSRSVIVAGGTMEPVEEFKALLTNNSGEGRVNIVQCGHVVPPENVLAICLTSGPSNVNLHFSYENRSSVELLREVGRILRNVSNIVPGGVVCFLPSYSYESQLYEHLASSGVIEAISKRKTVFREPKSAGDVDQVLQKYAAAAKAKGSQLTGALLLSVVGGKLSEGLNFSDDLGRCVVVVGMPYPNIKSPELQEKMNYINRMTPGGGNMFYENLCIKAVNQCIGRAVRHANDYACILLVDSRYSRPQTITALPSFVQKSLLPSCTFGQTIGSISKFFLKHKSKTSC